MIVKLFLTNFYLTNLYNLCKVIIMKVYINEIKKNTAYDPDKFIQTLTVLDEDWNEVLVTIEQIDDQINILSIKK